MIRRADSIYRFESISELHQFLGLPPSGHSLISLIDNSDGHVDHGKFPKSHTLGFYKISYLANLHGKFQYDQRFYDFKEGGLCFVSPNQLVANYNSSEDHSGYILLVHPDFLLNYPLIKKIRQYGFFSYSTNEALHLSESEKTTIVAIYRNITEELNGKLDNLSRDIIISQIELLLTYANRFYKRQFKVRNAATHDLLEKLETLLEDYFNRSELSAAGIPSVKYLSGKLNISPSYLSDMLRSLTGKNAQQHIHDKLIAKAKEKLSVTGLSISEIAFELGFEHTPSFTKLFKAKTKLSPLEFRQSFHENLDVRKNE